MPPLISLLPVSFIFLRAAPMVYGGSQANQTCSLWPTPQPQWHRILNPLSEARDWTCVSSWMLVRFLSPEPRQERLLTPCRWPMTALLPIALKNQNNQKRNCSWFSLPTTCICSHICIYAALLCVNFPCSYLGLIPSFVCQITLPIPPQSHCSSNSLLTCTLSCSALN